MAKQMIVRFCIGFIMSIAICAIVLGGHVKRTTPHDLSGNAYMKGSDFTLVPNHK